MELKYSGTGNVNYNEKVYMCDLYLNEQLGGVLLKIHINSVFASFLELPIEIDHLSGELNTGFKFSFLDCKRVNTLGNVSNNETIFSYIAKYMIEGINERINFYKISYEISNVINWGKLSGYAIGENGELKNNEECQNTLVENEEYCIKYIVKKRHLPIIKDELLNENIILNQTGNVEITFKDEKEIFEFETLLNKILKLIKIATLSSIQIKKITGWNKNEYNIYGDKRHEKPIKIISTIINYEQDNNRNIPKIQNIITLEELAIKNSFNKFFDKYEKLEQICDLYLQNINSREVSYINSFIYLTQALEIFHTRFKANSISDFENRVNNIILKDRPQQFIDNDKKMLIANSKKFITLRSRIADLLLAEYEYHFDTGDFNYYDFPEIVANTRNYYTHYDEELMIKKRILTTEELAIYNHTIAQMLDFYILKELGFEDLSFIREKINNRWNSISDILSIKEKSKLMSTHNDNK